MAIERRMTMGNVMSMVTSAIAAAATIFAGYGAYVTTQNMVRQNAKDIVSISAAVAAGTATAREDAAKARAEIDLRIENTRADYSKQLIDIRQDAGRQRETIQAMQIDAAKNGARFDALSDKLDELKGLVMQALDQKGQLRR